MISNKYQNIWLAIIFYSKPHAWYAHYENINILEYYIATVMTIMMCYLSDGAKPKVLKMLYYSHEKAEQLG